MYKVFAFDLDGTLVNSSKEVTQKNIDVLNELVKRGIKVVVCTGRPYSTAKRIVERIDDTSWTITCNGAVVKNQLTNELILNQRMKWEQVYETLDVLHREKIYFHAIIDEVIHAEKLESLALEYWEKNKQLPDEKKVEICVVRDIGDYVDATDSEVTKFISISKNTDKLLKARQAVEKIKGVDVISSGSDNFEVMPKGISKGVGLMKLANHLGIKQEEIVTIGDNENDISMIRYAGLGIAMGNADNYIKEISKKVSLSNNEDGVAYAIYNFVL